MFFFVFFCIPLSFGFWSHAVVVRKDGAALTGEEDGRPAGAEFVGQDGAGVARRQPLVAAVDADGHGHGVAASRRVAQLQQRVQRHDQRRFAAHGRRLQA